MADESKEAFMRHNIHLQQHKREKEGIFDAGTELYARGGSGSGAGRLQVPRLQDAPQAQRRVPGEGLSDRLRAGQLGVDF